MCQNKNTDSCTGDCNKCGSPSIYATDIHKRFEKLSRTTEPEPVVKEISSHRSEPLY